MFFLTRKCLYLSIWVINPYAHNLHAGHAGWIAQKSLLCIADAVTYRELVNLAIQYRSDVLTGLRECS